MRKEIKAMSWVTESYIIESVYPQDKVDAFIEHLADDDKTKVKTVISKLFKFMDSEKWEYVEGRKRATKGVYQAGRFGFGRNRGSNDAMDQFTWGLIAHIPKDPSKQRVYVYDICINKIEAFLKTLESSVKGNVITNYTNKICWVMLSIGDSIMVGIGSPMEGGGYAHEENTFRAPISFKLVVPHYEAKKSVANNTNNRKAILAKVQKLMGKRNMADVNKVLDNIYAKIEADGGYVEAKRATTGLASIETREYRYDDSKEVALDTISWKLEKLKDTSMYEFEVIKDIANGSRVYKTDIGSNTYSCVQVGDCFVGLATSFGSRGKRFVHLAVLVPMLDDSKVSFADSDNPFASKDGMSLRNDKCSVGYDRVSKQISGSDLTDQYNCPRFFSKGAKGKKNMDKAWEDILSQFDSTTAYYDVIGILANYSDYYDYCSMD